MRKLILAAVCLLAPIAAHAEMICRPIPQYPHLLSCYDPVTGASDQRVDDETQRAIDRKNTARSERCLGSSGIPNLTPA